MHLKASAFVNKVKTFFSYLGRFLDSPFRYNFSYFLTLYLLIVVLDFVGVLNGSSSFTFLFTGLFIAYVFSVGYGALKWSKFLRRVYNLLVFSVVLTFFMVDFFSLCIYGLSFNKDYAAAVINTNEAEMREFIMTYLSYPLLFGAAVLLIGLGWAIYKLLKKEIVLNRYVRYTWQVLVVVGMVLFFTHPMDKRSLYGKANLVFSPQTTPDLLSYYSHPALEVDTLNLPENVVMIVGESLTKHHCSLYGYGKKTNPHLEALRDTADLFVFKNVKSPAVNTEKSLRDVFTTYPERNVGPEWYRSVTLFEVMQETGYYSYWVSNQSKKGLWDNVIGRFSDLCNENYFVGNKFSGVKRTTTDDEILPLLHPLLNQDSLKKCFYTVHLLGSHPAFELRYPENFGIFTPEMYPGRSEREQEKTAAYDNSVLFNDSVVAEIIQMYEDKEAIIVYFSDHALDVFQTSHDYAGHAKSDSASTEFGKDIPFMIYVTPAYKARYPEKVALIASKVEEPLNTGNFIYMLMDLVGVRFKENLHVEDLSPFRE